MSYAIFTYKCGSLNWINHGAGIGFSASEEFFANHPLSRSNDVNDIACLNEPYSQWSNVIYKLTKCKSLYNKYIENFKNIFMKQLFKLIMYKARSK